MKVLVVEDEERIANTLKKGLEQERYVVDVAYDGLGGLDLALNEQYDVMILDLMLPGMDGMMVCKILREKGKHLPILMLTARGLTENKVEGLDVGADDYLTKPFSFEELLARIRALTRRPKNVISEVIEIGDLVLDPKKFEVKRGDKDLRLSNKEFSLLEYMMRHVNKILTKDQIISNVWNFESDILPNTVEVYMRNLRKKIGEDKIETIRGFGYKLCSTQQD